MTWIKNYFDATKEKEKEKVFGVVSERLVWNDEQRHGLRLEECFLWHHPPLGCLLKCTWSWSYFYSKSIASTAACWQPVAFLFLHYYQKQTAKRATLLLGWRLHFSQHFKIDKIAAHFVLWIFYAKQLEKEVWHANLYQIIDDNNKHSCFASYLIWNAEKELNFNWKLERKHVEGND